MSAKSFNLNINQKISPFKKKIEIDSDKSISIRSFLIGAISQNISINSNVLQSEDVISTIECLKKLGVKIKKKSAKNYSVYGKGLGSLYIKKNMELNFGNSATAARLLIGILSTTPGIEIKIKGDKSLNKRSMKKLIELMSKFGATFLPKNKFTFPLKMISSEMPVAIKYNAGVSAQLKSAVIFAGLNAFGTTKILEQEKSRDHTENILLKNTKAIRIVNRGKKIIYIEGRKYLNPINLDVPGDPSSAAFFVALTLLNRRSSITIKNVGLNETRIGLLEVLLKMNADIQIFNKRVICNEICGDLIVKSSNLVGIEVPDHIIPNIIDEIPILSIAACFAKGQTIIKNASELKVKESDRLNATSMGLRVMKINHELLADGLIIEGTKNDIEIQGEIDSFGDHRIAMSFLVAGTRSKDGVMVKNCNNINTSFPDFCNTMNSLNMSIHE